MDHSFEATKGFSMKKKKPNSKHLKRSFEISFIIDTTSVNDFCPYCMKVLNSLVIFQNEYFLHSARRATVW
jgi:thiol-disulfide isomerase/thioredoxin